MSKTSKRWNLLSRITHNADFIFLKGKKKNSYRCLKFQNLYFSLFSCVNSAVVQHGSISLFISVNVQQRHIAFSMFTLHQPASESPSSRFLVSASLAFCCNCCCLIWFSALYHERWHIIWKHSYVLSLRCCENICLYLRTWLLKKISRIDTKKLHTNAFNQTKTIGWIFVLFWRSFDRNLINKSFLFVLLEHLVSNLYRNLHSNCYFCSFMWWIEWYLVHNSISQIPDLCVDTASTLLFSRDTLTYSCEYKMIYVSFTQEVANTHLKSWWFNTEPNYVSK